MCRCVLQPSIADNGIPAQACRKRSLASVSAVHDMDLMINTMHIIRTEVELE